MQPVALHFLNAVYYNACAHTAAISIPVQLHAETSGMLHYTLNTLHTISVCVAQ